MIATNSDEKRAVLLNELAEISPMSADEVLDEMSEEEASFYLDKLQYILDELEQVKDTSSLVPLLRSFGLGLGGELYQSIMHACERLIEFFPSKEDFLEVLRRELKTGLPGSRQWISLLLGRNRDPKDAEQLMEIALYDPVLFVRQHALMALSMVCNPDVIPQLRILLEDPSEEIRSMAAETIEDIQESRYKF